jgi:hypothetical protein
MERSSMNALSALLFATACLTAVPAHAQTPTRGVPLVKCNTSFLATTPEMTCMASRGVVNDNRIGGKEYHVAGVLNDRSVFMVLSTPAVGSIRAYSEQTSVNVLKNLNDLTRRQGKEWSAITTEGNTSSMRFKADNQDCIAFDHAGPLKEGGYAWALRGYLCAATGMAPITDDVVKAYLAATRVGNTRDNLNAYGQPIRPLTAKPQS